jgi:hypothetical protein
MPTGVLRISVLASVSAASCPRMAASRWPSKLESSSVNCQAGEVFSARMP